ncbi:MAG: dockerin type I repeat-containing protein [Phycisphaeraceae bacterium]|nr:dockerin type I repeat-containing protein [Phycisphaeraceae bacterium]
MLARKFWTLILAAGFAPAAFGALSGNLLTPAASTFQGSGFGSGSEDIESVVKLNDSPLTPEEITAGTNPVRSWQFHPAFDLGVWIGDYAISAHDDPRYSYAHGTGTAPLNRSVIQRNGSANGVLEGVSFRPEAGIFLPAPPTSGTGTDAWGKTGTAQIDYDYFFNYWDQNQANWTETTIMGLRVFVYGVTADQLPTWQDRWGPEHYNANSAGFDLLYYSMSWSSKSHALDLLGTPDSAYVLPDNQWHTLSDGISAVIPQGYTPQPGDKTFDDGTFALNQTYAYYFVDFWMVSYNEASPHFWLEGGTPSDTFWHAIDNVSLQVPIWVRGDFNGDGVVTLSDITPFKQALTDTAAWQALYPSIPLGAVDPNGDGVITLSDINPFKAILTGGSGAEVPEPASLGLLTLGALALLRRRA